MDSFACAEQFLALVHGTCADGGYIEVRPGRRVEGRLAMLGPPSRAWFQNTPGGRAAARAHAGVLTGPGTEIFIGVALRSAQGKGTADDAAWVSVIWADIDFKNSSENEAASYLAALSQADLVPLVLVESGAGRHVYLGLSSPVDLRDAGPARLHRRANQLLAATLHGDRAVVDPARVMRLPGSLNCKYDPPKAVTADFDEGATRYSLEEYIAKLEALAPRPVAAGVTGVPTAAIVTTKADPCRAARETVSEGARHDSLLSLGGWLAGHGVGIPMMAAILTAANKRNCSPPLPPDEVEAIIRFATSKREDHGAPRALGAALPLLVPGVRYRPSLHSIAFEYFLTGEPCEWRVLVERDLRADSMRTVGALETLACAIHPKATPRKLLAALQDLVPPLPSIELANNLDEEVSSIRLQRALLHGPVWKTEEDPHGHGQRVKTTLALDPGLYGGDGVGLLWTSEGRGFLCVNLVSAVSGVLRDHPDFGRGRMTVSQLARVLKSAPGFVSQRARVAGLRLGRWWQIDVTDLLDPADDKVGTAGTPGTPAEDAVPSVPSDNR